MSGKGVGHGHGHGHGGVDLPKGRWAQRMDTNASGITVKSFYQGDSVIPFPPPQSNFNTYFFSMSYYLLY